MPVRDRLRAMRPNCFAPCAGYLLATTNEPGSKDRTFNCLDRRNRYVLAHIQIDCTHPGVRIGRNVLLNFTRAPE